MAIKYFGCALAVALPLLPVSAQESACNAGKQGEIRTFKEVVQSALEADLRPALADQAVAVARTDKAIADLRPLDSLSLEIENFPGIGLAGNIDNLEITGRFSRVWERGGKREARQALARAGVALAETEHDIIRHDIVHVIETLYIEAALLEQRAQLACDRVEISSSMKETVDRRVDAARDPVLAQARSLTDLARAQSEAAAYRRLAQERRLAISGMWRSTEDFAIEPDFVKRRLETARLEINEVYSPQFEKLQAEDRRLTAEIELKKAESVPDLTWSAGVRKFGYQEDMGVVGGISIPLGTRTHATARAAKAQAQQGLIAAQERVLRQQLLREAVGYQRAAQNALESMSDIDERLLPEAIRALELAQDGYGRGAFSYLEIIDAQRTLAELREQRLGHVETFILNEAALARVTGREDWQSLVETNQ
ncbi:TolC family protein [Hyphomonas sp.]|uniref:TolC family protein n=1 Tax=Hyphomonas sp. TaxID=87 RepID=UPI0025C19D8B|nr:TolC family protein [Hyphomonas sp.]